MRDPSCGDHTYGSNCLFTIIWHLLASQRSHFSTAFAIEPPTPWILNAATVAKNLLGSSMLLGTSVKVEAPEDILRCA